jgi:hypothetical protein
MLSISLFKISPLSDSCNENTFVMDQEPVIEAGQSPAYSACPTAALELYKDKDI